MIQLADAVDEALLAGVRAVGADQLLDDPDRAVRFAEFAAVGGTGAVVNTAVFLTLVGGGIHYLLAGALAFVVAVSWNFSGNWLLTFGRPSGHLHRQYMQFVAVSLGGFAIYSLTLVVMIDGLGAAPLAANVAGIATSGLWNFFGADEFAFEEDASVGAKAAVSVNRAAHLLYRGRVKRRLRGTLAYHAAYRAYCVLLAVAMPDTYQFQAGGQTVSMAATSGAEAVSLLHTTRKEQPVLDRFAAECQPNDVVWDVGANLGVYSCVAATAGATVIAFEPFPETAARIPENARMAGCDRQITAVSKALDSSSGRIPLGVERTEVGTQTPARALADDSGTQTVEVPATTGDAATEQWPPPDVLKIDVEGAEHAVLDGMTGALEGVRCLFVEAHGGHEADRLREWLAARGFAVDELHRYDNERYLIATRPSPDHP